MARALIVGCGCRGRELGRELLDTGWQVRGTSRGERGLAEIEASGIEGAIADPDRAATIIELIDDVAVIFWLLGSARGGEAEVAALHGPRLERLLEEIVDTHVRGFVYEAVGEVPAERLREGAAAVRSAAARWRIPAEVVAVAPRERERWRRAMVDAATAVLTP